MSAPSSIWELEKVDWNFADYSSSQFPTDINSLHWYPAVFVPQIPSILIKCLSQERELVLDPFSGSGTTIIEASRLGRRFFGVDRNPYAVNICKAKINAISEVEEEWFEQEERVVRALDLIKDPNNYCTTKGINPEVYKWFENNTLIEILTIHQHIIERRDTYELFLGQIILSSILNRCCSQRDHYTYITDRCFPKEMIYRPTREMYCEQVKLASQSIIESRRQFKRIKNREWKPSEDGDVKCCDSRQIGWIENGTVDLVVTSPPYLGVNDYVRSMRLTSLLFPEEGDQGAVDAEIGARRKRQKATAFDDYKQDMYQVFSGIARVLKRDGYLALVIGQGKGKVNKENIIDMLIGMLQEEFEFEELFRKERRIKFRRIQVPGVGTECIVVLRR